MKQLIFVSLLLFIWISCANDSTSYKSENLDVDIQGFWYCIKKLGNKEQSYYSEINDSTFVQWYEPIGYLPSFSYYRKGNDSIFFNSINLESHTPSFIGIIQGVTDSSFVLRNTFKSETTFFKRRTFEDFKNQYGRKWLRIK